MKPRMFWTAVAAIVCGGELNVLVGGWAWPLPGIVLLIAWTVLTIE